MCENRELEDVYVLYITSYCLQQAIVFTPCRQAEEKLCVLVKNLCECVSFSMDACAHMLYMQMCANFAWKRGRVEVSINHCPVLSFVYVCVCSCRCALSETGGDFTHVSTTTELVASSLWSPLEFAGYFVSAKCT